MLQSMAVIGDTSREGLAIRSELYGVALQCLADDSQFAAGLQLAEEAFSSLPPSHTGRLWSSRLLFQSKLGQDVALSLAAMRDVRRELERDLIALMRLLMSSRPFALLCRLRHLNSRLGCG
jgi:hypothetical protein